MRFEMGFDCDRALQIMTGEAPPLPTKCRDGYRIGDLPHYPGYVMQVVPNFGESDFACACELAAVTAYVAEHPYADGRYEPKLSLFQAVSATSPFPTRILPPAELASQGDR